MIEVQDVVNDSLKSEVENEQIDNENDYYNQKNENTSSWDIFLRYMKYIMKTNNWNINKNWSFKWLNWWIWNCQ